jgi:hypothetical protein
VFNFFISALLLFYFGNVFGSSANSILDIYLDLPNDFLNLTHDSSGRPYSKGEREKAIKTKDVKNGYIHVKDPDSIGEYTLTVFRLNNGESIVALNSSGETVETFQILKKEKGVWKDVSSTYLPSISNEFILKSYQKKFPNDKRFKNLDFIEGYAQSVVRYKLPQKGTTIEGLALDEPGISGEVLFYLDFDRSKFSIRN